ncbi:MAG: hypothetical protein ACU84Q_19960 [Gammaproteobacteria bacterium]
MELKPEQIAYLLRNETRIFLAQLKKYNEDIEIIRVMTTVALPGMISVVSAEGFMPWTKVTEMAHLNDDGMVDAGELKQAKEMFKMDDPELSQAFFRRQGFMPRKQ